MIKCGVIGATGYAGVELVRLLSLHPEAEIAALSSVSFTGKPLSDVYPSFLEVRDDILCAEDDAIDRADVVFASLPHGLSQGLAKKCADAGKLFIDLGADFRLYDGEVYKEWYGCEFEDRALHGSAVYGLSEIYRDRIRGARLIANPGCYPTASALAVYPLLSNGICSTEGIIIDAKSGVTGAGRSLTQNTHYAELNEGFAPYKLGAHRHTPEIEQTLSEIAGRGVRVTFSPHLLPVNRGILATVYLENASGVSAGEAREVFLKAYRGERFVRVLPEGGYADIKNVRLSNFCDISVHEDRHTNKLIIVSAIDNMVKGAAGQAIQNMNISLGIEESMGLTFLPPAI